LFPRETVDSTEDCPAAPFPKFDTSSNLFGYRLSIGVTQAVDGGNGFIDEEIWLKSRDGPGWIEAGYVDQTSPTYFWAENDQANGVFVSHVLGPVPAEDVGYFAVVEISNNGPNRRNSKHFTVSIKTHTQSFVQPDVTNDMWSMGTDQFGEVDFGQELAGTAGARADYVAFANNSWMDEGGAWHLQTADASVTSEAPPFGGWLQGPCDANKSSAPS
jgi:hypothetical protein